MKRLIALTSVALACLGTAHAAVITEIETYSPVLVVDGGTRTTTLDITDQGTISDVDVHLTFSKCDGSITSTGQCTGTGFSFLNEIVVSLTSPTGTTVALIPASTYSGGTNVSNVDLTLDDDATATLAGTPTPGTFLPANSLSAFNGELMLGSWTLTFRDTAGADPFSINEFGLSIDNGTAGGNVPSPAPLALMGLGLIGMMRLRRKD